MLPVPVPLMPAVSVTGGAIGVTLLDALDAGPEPMPLVATTLHVTAVPALNPVTVIGDILPVADLAPGLQVAV
jgi:hypothetical protein